MTGLIAFAFSIFAGTMQSQDIVSMQEKHQIQVLQKSYERYSATSQINTANCQKVDWIKSGNLAGEIYSCLDGREFILAMDLEMMKWIRVWGK